MVGEFILAFIVAGIIGGVFILIHYIDVEINANRGYYGGDDSVPEAPNVHVDITVPTRSTMGLMPPVEIQPSLGQEIEMTSNVMLDLIDEINNI